MRLAHPNLIHLWNSKGQPIQCEGRGAVCWRTTQAQRAPCILPPGMLGTQHSTATNRSSISRESLQGQKLLAGSMTLNNLTDFSEPQVPSLLSRSNTDAHLIRCSQASVTTGGCYYQQCQHPQHYRGSGSSTDRPRSGSCLHHDVTVDKLLHLSEPQVLHPQNGGRSIQLSGFWQGHTKCDLPVVSSNKKKPRGFPGGSVVKNPPANAGDTNLIPGLGRFHTCWSTH